MAAIRSSFAHASPEDADARAARGSTWWTLAVIALSIVALAARHVGLDFLLPERMEGDGGVLVRQVALLDERADVAARAADACWGYYPHVVARVTEACTSSADIPQPGPDAPLAEHLAAASVEHVRVRSVVTWFAALLVPATWLLARRFFTRGVALLACAFVAVSPLLVVVGQEARPHAPAAALALLAVLAALRLRAAPTWSAYLVAGCAAAFAIGALQSGVAVLLPIAAAHALRERNGPARVARALGQLACVLAPVALAALWLYPHATAPLSGASATELGLREDGNFQFFSHTVFLDQFDGRGFVNLARVLASFEPLLALCALAGVLAWAFGRRGLTRDALVVLAYVVPYTLVIGAYARTYERFVVQLLPFAACAAAYAIARVATDRALANASVAAPASVSRRALACALALFALAVPAWTSARTLALRAGPATTDELAQRCVELGLAERIACVPFADLPLVRDDAALEELHTIGWQSPWMGYQREHAAALPAAPRFDLRTLPLGRKKVRNQVLADPAAYLRGTGAQLFVVPALSVLAGDEAFRALHAELERAGQLVVRCGASAAPRTLGDLPLDATNSTAWERCNWTWRVFTGDAQSGDVLELWRME